MGLLLMLAAAHVVLCPFTKVEESFNTQAMHDLSRFFQTLDVHEFDKFDHHEFSGVVPRTFLGALVVTGATVPLGKVLTLVLPLVIENGEDFEWVARLIACRLTLAFMVWLSLCRLSFALKHKFGVLAANWFGFICCCQFHLVFYMGRPLPNTFALGICAMALARWLEGFWEESVGLLTLCTVIFRCDTLILTGIVALLILIRRETGILAMIVDGVASGASSLFLTVGLDSFMWKRWLWPEGVVLFFNTVMNKSKEWGVMAPHWYFTNALPKALLICYPLSLCAGFQSILKIGKAAYLANSKLKGFPLFVEYTRVVFDIDALVYLVLPSFLYVGAYSILPHKEVRFLFQVFPFFSSAAALMMMKLQMAASTKKKDFKSRFRRAIGLFGFIGANLGLLLSFGLATLYLLVATKNYPGAEALMFVQQKATEEKGHSTVHYCVFAAMTGISRFLEHGSKFLTYSKQEDEAFLQMLCAADGPRFDFLIMETAHWEASGKCMEQYSRIHTIQGSPTFSWQTREITTSPVLEILTIKR